MKTDRKTWRTLAQLTCWWLLLSGCGGTASRNASGGESGGAGSDASASTIGSSSSGRAATGWSSGGSVGGGADGGTSSSAGAGAESPGAPPSKVVDCEGPYDLDDVAGYGTADEKREYTGVNGTFVDYCVDGNLIDYACEITGGDFPTPTGEVIFNELNCSGRCQDGTCPELCLRGETMRFTAVLPNGIHEMTNIDNGRAYQCELISDDDFCRSLEPGAEMVVVFGPEFQCTSDYIGDIALGSDNAAQCYYENCQTLYFL